MLLGEAGSGAVTSGLTKRPSPLHGSLGSLSRNGSLYGSNSSLSGQGALVGLPAKSTRIYDSTQKRDSNMSQHVTSTLAPKSPLVTTTLTKPNPVVIEPQQPPTSPSASSTSPKARPPPARVHYTTVPKAVDESRPDEMVDLLAPAASVETGLSPIDENRVSQAVFHSGSTPTTVAAATAASSNAHHNKAAHA